MIELNILFSNVLTPTSRLNKKYCDGLTISPCDKLDGNQWTAMDCSALAKNKEKEKLEIYVRFILRLNVKVLKDAQKYIVKV